MGKEPDRCYAADVQAAGQDHRLDDADEPRPYRGDCPFGSTASMASDSRWIASPIVS